MTQRKIRISTIAEAKDFVARASECDFDINIFYNRVIIDAKSILGVLSLDFTKVLTVEFSGENPGFEEFLDDHDAAKGPRCGIKIPQAGNTPGLLPKDIFVPWRQPLFIRSRPRPWPALHRCFRSSSETGKPEESLSAKLQILKILNVHDLTVLKQLFMAGQVCIVHGIQSDHIESDPLVMPLYNVIQDLIIHTWIISKIRLCSPALIPSQIKKQEIRLLCQGPVSPDAVHGNCISLRKVPAVDHQRLSHKLVRRELVQGRPSLI